MHDLIKNEMTADPKHEQSLKQRWDDFRHNNPKIRIREAARKLGVSELELVASGCADKNIRLRPDWNSLMSELETLGEVLTITRNDAVVHETQGRFTDMNQHGNVAMFFTPGIDTRFFLDRWKSVFAVNENDRLSLQIFDACGVAAHKVYVTESTDLAAYERLVENYRALDQGDTDTVLDTPMHLAPSLELDSDTLKMEWLAIKDVHEATRLIRRYGGYHEAVYETLGEEFARPLATNTVEQLLEQLSAQKMSCMIFAMNNSAVQAYAGPINRLMRTGPGFNVLDPEFNLHISTADIGGVWYLRKPSDDGWISTLHIFDRHCREIMLIADNRQKRLQERSSWRDLLLSLADQNPERKI